MKDHDLHVYNSLSREKEEFKPLTEGHVGMYVCGPTVYSDAHLGHAKSYVSFDVIVRYLRHLGFKLRYVQNITDVGHLTDDADEGEDKLEKRARLDQVHPMELAETYTRRYLRDMDALKVVRADIYPRATQHVPEQIAIVKELVEKGHAYEVNGNVYFSVPSWEAYGCLSGRKSDEQEAVHRVEVRSDKKDPRDFALWKVADGGHILRWDSPWGWGYPGWHVECSAMAVKYLGETFDIHGGGLENQFPHHECEIAQSNATGHPFARYWLHNNMINVDGVKMGKSLGNFVTIEDALRDHDPEAIRAFLLMTHFRSPANYTVEGLTAARNGLDRLQGCVAKLVEATGAAPEAEGPSDAVLAEAVARADRDFHAAMDDDFNTPIAVAALYDLVKPANLALAAGNASRAALQSALDLFTGLGEEVLGIVGDPTVDEGSMAADPFIELLLSVRHDLKQQKLFDVADHIRNGLTDAGIEVQDGKDGATWSRK
ncbi:MAG: cysteine--tRNA ligase [Planctomycetes bacterium]|nr:cysteine--tRNA ligase [Planctomycetota bacterium]